MGVQKPGDVAPTNPHTAATEKIVADLAAVIGLPVPPVTLWDRGSATAGFQYVSVSAWAFEQPLTWAQADALLSPAQRAQLVRPASAIIPFEVWIEAQDRQNASNMLVGTPDPSGELAGAWIDYAFALDHVWKGNQHLACAVTPLYPPVGGPDIDMMKAVAGEITSIDNAVIQGIINRIPSTYLPRAVADNIIQTLLSRRAAVRALWP